MVKPTPIKKNLAALKSSILAPSLTSHFECYFDPPDLVRTWMQQRSAAGLGVPYEGNEGLISLSCTEATLPGSSIATHEQLDDFTGVTERHAYRRQYDERAEFTFYVDGDYKVLQFFENWMAFIVNEQRTPSAAFGPDITQPNHAYRVNFPKSYQTDNLYVQKFEKDYRKTLTYQFFKAFPVSMNSMPVSYNGSELLRCTVGFTYSRYVIFEEDISLGSFSDPDSILSRAAATLPTPDVDDVEALFN
jgi:hypothetical protein